MASIWALVTAVAVQGMLDITYAMPAARVQNMSPEMFYRAVPSSFPKLSFAEKTCTSMFGRLGRCVSYPECEGPLMLREGVCSSNFGVCCVELEHPEDCNSTLNQSVESDHEETHLRIPVYIDEDDEPDAEISEISNPGYPLPTTQPLWSFDVIVLIDVCQLRLDFEEFDLPPSKVFQMTINGVGIAPPLTGNNSGQHLIVDVTAASVKPARVELSLSGPPVETVWKFRVQNIPCYSRMHAPKGCLQYHLGSTGYLRSLGVATAEQTPYAACIRAHWATGTLLSLKTVRNEDNYTCDNFMQVPPGVGLAGEEIPSKVCASDFVDLTYQVFGPLVFYMFTSSGSSGIEVEYTI